MIDYNLIDRIGQSAYSTKETLLNTVELTKYVCENNIEGDLIECGVAAGSQIGVMGYILDVYNSDKKVIGFDSFEGIPLASKDDDQQPGIGDIIHDVNVSKRELLKSSGITVHSMNDVYSNLQNWGISLNRFALIKGWFQNRIPLYKKQIDSISLLRLDGDLYESTKVCLKHLFPLVSKGGVIIIDDWNLAGCRKACNEYFGDYSEVSDIHYIENNNPIYFYKK